MNSKQLILRELIVLFLMLLALGLVVVALFAGDVVTGFLLLLCGGICWFVCLYAFLNLNLHHHGRFINASRACARLGCFADRSVGYSGTTVVYTTTYDTHPIECPRPATGQSQVAVTCRRCGKPVTVFVASPLKVLRFRQTAGFLAFCCAAYLFALRAGVVQDEELRLFLLVGSLPVLVIACVSIRFALQNECDAVLDCGDEAKQHKLFPMRDV